MDQLFASIRAGDEAKVKDILTQQPLLLNMRDQSTSFTPLHLAASVGVLPIVRLLLSLGCDGSAKTLGGKTFRDVAKQKVEWFPNFLALSLSLLHVRAFLILPIFQLLSRHRLRKLCRRRHRHQ